ncbi:class II aldolase/adducin family protein [Bacteroidota bacterium]
MRTGEGYIKFNLNWDQRKFEFGNEDFNYINSCRDKLFDLGLIGVYPNGIGFGNLSIRYHNNEFIISGSATGNIPNLTKDHFALVKVIDIENNSVQCVGQIEASSESLSHGVIYEVNSAVNAVIHIHHKDMWNQYINNLPTTNKNAEFGTPEVALEIAKLTNEDSGIIIMAGHPEGIITYGKTLEDAYKKLLKYYNKL